MCVGGYFFEIVEIVDMYDIGRYFLQDGRCVGCGDGCDDFGFQVGEESCKLVKMIWFGGDGDVFVVEMEMFVQQCVL